MGPSPGGRFQANNVTLLLLLRYAYDVPVARMSGAPSWARTERFDVDAKLPDNAHDTAGDLTKKALRRLLAERFRLSVAHDITTRRVFELVVASPNRPGLRRAPAECQHSADETAPRATGKCLGGLDISGSRFSMTATRLSQLAAWLSSATGRTVVDRTELSGLFDIDLQWSDKPEGPSLLAALQEQLGLKLVEADGAVSTLKIVRVERLSPE